MRKRIGGCNCGQVRFEVSGEPLRVGLCHCLVCRKETGSLGNFFAVWTSDHVSVTGETGSWRLTTDNRHFCATCGSSVFALIDGANEIEVRVGAFDEVLRGGSPRGLQFRRASGLVLADESKKAVRRRHVGRLDSQRRSAVKVTARRGTWISN